MKIIVSALQLVSLAIGSKAFDTPVPESHEVKEDFLNAKGEANYFFHTNSIDEYAIDDKNWSTDTFTLGDLKFEDTYGYVNSSAALPMDHKGYNEDIMRLCGEDLRKGANNERTFTMPLHNYSVYGTLNFFNTTKRFSDFQGIDLVPRNKGGYYRGSPYLSTLDFKAKEDFMGDEDVIISRCKVPLENGEEGGWVVERVGPMYATGGYDWWQIGWTDVGGFSEVLKKHPDGFDVDVKAMMPVSEDGRRLGHPPIHIHHIHVVSNLGVRPRNKMRNLCYGDYNAKSCYNSSLFMEQHGDYQCNVEDDGIECLTTKDMRRFRQELDIEGELNDIRPAGSETIKFYYQTAFRWTPVKKEKRAVSQTTIMAPAKIDLRDQLTRTVTFPTPTHAEHMLWYTGRVWADGELYRNKLHAHNMVFESSEFFLAEPRDLGLDQKRMQPAKSYEPLQTNELGFSSNAKFRQWLMDNLEEAQRKYDQNCVEREDQSHEACGRPRPRLVCIAKYDSEGFHWGKPKYHVDRRPKTHCKPWKFREGDAFTVTGFSRHLTEPTKPDQPGYVPAFIPGHISWHMWWYHDTWSHSYFNRIVCNQKGIWFDSSRFYGVTFPFKQVASLLTEGGIPKGFTQSYVVDGIAVSGACLIVFLLCRAILRKSNEFRYKKLS